MKERAVAMEKTRSLENLHELRLMALLLDVIREKGRMEAADLLGVNYKTLARAVETGSLSPRMSHALDRLLLSQKTKATARQQERIEALEQRVETLEQKIESSLGKVRAFVESQVKAFGDEHVRALRQLERRVAEVGAGQGSGSGANAVRKPVGNTTFRRKYPELVTREPAPDDEEVYGAAWPLVEEWRRLRDGHPSDGKSLSWLVTEERILDLELAMAEEHGLTLPPETQPLRGVWRNGQRRSIEAALGDTRWARTRRERLRWVRTALEGLLLSREQAAMAAQQEIERVLQVGFELARGRRKKLTSVDKANVLETSRLWRQIAIELGPEYPDVHLEHMLVDTCAMQLIQRPSSFDVIVAENTFGDILTDEAAVLTASMGLLPSASLAFSPETTRQPSGGDAPPVATSGSKAKRPERGRKAALRMYEPIHGSAPDIAGQGVANPIATILSVALMMRYSLGLTQEAAAVEGAVKQVLQDGRGDDGISQQFTPLSEALVRRQDDAPAFVAC